MVATLRQRERPWGLPVQAGPAPAWAARGAQFLYATLEQILKAGYAPMVAATNQPS